MIVQSESLITENHMEYVYLVPDNAHLSEKNIAKYIAVTISKTKIQ